MRTLAYPLLWCLSRIYRLACVINYLQFKLGLRQRRKLPGKTWSIGNLAVGGTGKSPVTVALARMLIDAGARPVILTRGYGVKIARGDSMILKSGSIARAALNANTMPDEARMQSAMLPQVPVVVGPDRWQAAQDFLRDFPESNPSHWLLDDGFQHLALERDLDLVLLDASDPLPRLLPLGRAREPARALERADVVLFTRCAGNLPTSDSVTKVTTLLRPEVPLIKSSMVTSFPRLSCKGDETFALDQHAPVCLVSGIAQPTQLLDAVQKLGIKVGATLTLSDHQSITKSALRYSMAGQKAVLTTAKDYWRNPQVFDDLELPVFVLDLRLAWDAEDVGKALHRYL